MVNYIEYYRFISLLEKKPTPSIEDIMSEFRVDEREATRLVEGVAEVFESDFTAEQAITNLNNQKFKVTLDYIELRFVQFMIIESTMMNYSTLERLGDAVLKAVIRPIDEVEFLDSNTKTVSEAILAMNAKYLIPVATEVLKRRQNFHQRQFSGVFFKKTEEKEENEETEEAEEEKVDKEAESVDKKYYWYNLLDELAGGNVLNHEKVMQLEMGFVAPKVSKDRTYARIEYKRQKSEAARMKLKSRR